MNAIVKPLAEETNECYFECGYHTYLINVPGFAMPVARHTISFHHECN